MDETIEQVLSYFIFDADNRTKGNSFSQYLTIYQIEKIVEGETE